MSVHLDAELAAAAANIDRIDLADVAEVRRQQRLAYDSQQRRLDKRVELGYLRTDGEEGPSVLLRSYRRRDLRSPVPGLIWLHGGGFALGFCEIDDDLCIELSVAAGCHVFAPEYRLAPENPFPAGFDDAYFALDWLVKRSAILGVDPERIAIAGGSAGGALAAVVCQRARDEGGPQPCLQLLVYPVIDDRLETVSMRTLVDVPIHNRADAALTWAWYLGAEQKADHPAPYAVPARAEDLSGLPPAFVLTAGVDVLRDEGLSYARRLIETGVEVELHHYPTAFHGFDVHVPQAKLSVRARAEYAGALTRAFSH